MKLTLTGAGVKIGYKTPVDLVQKIRVELDRTKVKEKKLTDKISELKKKRTFLEIVLKQYTETL